MSQDALEQGTSPGEDAVDAIVGQWRTERPDLDPSAKEVTGRVIRLAGIFQDHYGQAFSPLGIGESEYGILAALRRAGEPYRLTPTALARQRMMTSGGMTALLDRVERKGFVARTPNPEDRRGSLVGLTGEGLRVIDEAMAVHAEVEHRLVAGLPATQREQLAGLLRRLLIDLDPR